MLLSWNMWIWGLELFHESLKLVGGWSGAVKSTEHLVFALWLVLMLGYHTPALGKLEIALCAKPSQPAISWIQALQSSCVGNEQWMNKLSPVRALLSNTQCLILPHLKSRRCYFCKSHTPIAAQQCCPVEITTKITYPWLADLLWMTCEYLGNFCP